MTRIELINMLSAKLAEKTELTAAQFLDAVTNASPADRAQLLIAVNKRDAKQTAELLIKISWAKRLALANTAVTAAFADDTVTTAELLSFL